MAINNTRMALLIAIAINNNNAINNNRRLLTDTNYMHKEWGDYDLGVYVRGGGYVLPSLNTLYTALAAIGDCLPCKLLQLLRVHSSCLYRQSLTE